MLAYFPWILIPILSSARPVPLKILPTKFKDLSIDFPITDMVEFVSFKKNK